MVRESEPMLALEPNPNPNPNPNPIPKQVRETEPVLALEPAFGGEYEWAQLHGQCFELKSELSVGTFTFKLCPFGRAITLTLP